MGKKKTSVGDSGKGLGVSTVLYRSGKKRWTTEPCVNDVSCCSRLTKCVTSPVEVISDVSVKSWLATYCGDSLISNSLLIHDNLGVPVSVQYLQGIVNSNSSVSSNVEPIDIGSTEDIKAIKSKNRGVSAVFETQHGCDFNVYVNAGGPIWSTAFAPDDGISVTDDNDKTRTVTTKFDKYLAVGLSRIGWPLEGSSHTVDGRFGIGADTLRPLDQRDSSQNLLQIWHLSSSIIRHRQPVVYKNDQRGKGSVKGRPKGSTKVAKKSKKTNDSDGEDYENEGDRGDSSDEDDEPVLKTKTSATVKKNSTYVPLGSDVERSSRPLLDEYFDIVEPVEPVSEVPQPSIHLSYCVHMVDRGPVWQLSWCPTILRTSSTTSSSSSSSSANVNAALGVLAVVCGDGSCVVLVLPKRSQPSSDDLSQVPVFKEQSVGKFEISLSENIMIQSVAWNPHKPFELLCGANNGMIFGYSLDETLLSQSINSPTRLSAPDFCLCDADVDNLVPTFAAVNCLQVCPYNSNWVLSGCCDSIRIWDLSKPFLPLYVKPKISKITQVEWDPCGVGFYYTEQSSTSVMWERGWSDLFEKLARGTLYNHVHKYGGIWCLKSFISDEQTYVLSVASDGTVRAGFPSIVGVMKAPSCDGIVELFRVQALIDSGGGSGSPAATVVVAREHLCVDDGPPLEYFVEVNDVAMHTIDTSPLLSDISIENIQSGSSHVVAYGGASGLLRLHVINPLKLTFRCPKRG